MITVRISVVVVKDGDWQSSSRVTDTITVSEDELQLMKVRLHVAAQLKLSRHFEQVEHAVAAQVAERV